ncbi:hypothetical protein J4E80_002992 [Alternaria sp. BMP 0032]|nr:hypothetical protein J4E80_002992 [Alternaria sp. BMP 0032]
MTTTIKEWMSNLCIYEDDDFVCHRNWGFTIYRTGYGPSSDQQWQRLLQKIQTDARKGALEATGTEEDESGFQQVWALFRLDARSDPALAGLDVDQLRELYNKGEGEQPMNTDYDLHRIFLFADDEALSDPTASIIKAVDADYRPEDHVSRNPRVGRQRYFGWMPMKASSVAELWARLDIWEMSRIAPPTIGGSHLVVWDGNRL